MPTIYKPKKRKQKSNNMYDDARRKIYNSERWGIDFISIR